VTPFCFGDDTLPTLCPCFNPGASGHGCANSQNANGALLTASGTVSPDTMVLQSSGELPTALTIMLQSSGSNPGGSTFGDGIITDKPLDEVILAYLVEKARHRKRLPT